RARTQAGMLGINLGVPAPTAFFSFGGWKHSLFGDLHAHGPDAVAFYTRKKVVTERWFGAEAPKMAGSWRRPLPLQGTSRQAVFPAQGGDRSAWYCSARRRACQSHGPVLSNWLFCRLDQPRPCAGEPAVTNHKSVLRAGTTRSRDVSAGRGHQ